METNLLDKMLSAYQDDQTTITITLQNKIRVSGKIKAFDSYIILLNGQKRSVVYRHAVSCISTQAPDKQIPTGAVKPAPLVSAAPAAKPARPPQQKPRRQPSEAALSASSSEPGLNNSMKEGLLKWMREQKASK